MITSEPLLHGSQNDHWAQRKPLVIFPCGAIHKDGTWLVTCGVNDMKSAWVELSHESLLSKMRPIGDVSDTIFGQNGLSEGEKNLSGVPAIGNPEIREPLRTSAQNTLEKRRAALVKARAARAANREQLQKQKEAFIDDYAKSAALETFNNPPSDIPTPRKKRRRKRFKRITSEARMKALKEWEAKKNIAPT